MNSNFEYYKIFYYVAKYENLTKAATALKTSQPAVTRTIHKLEGELGCRLFTRSKTGMKLTPEGRTFYGYVAAGCAQFFKGDNDLSNLIFSGKWYESISVRRRLLFTVICFRRWKNSTVCIRM